MIMKKSTVATINIFIVAFTRTLPALRQEIDRLDVEIRKKLLLGYLNARFKEPVEKPAPDLIKYRQTLEDAYCIRGACIIKFETFLNAVERLFNPKPGGIS
jgi:hypothetical protein